MSVLLDTNIVLYALQNRLDEPLPETDVLISVISEIELLSFPGLSSAETTQIVSLLAQMTVVGLEDAVKAKAIQLRRNHKLKLPDAIILASAAVHGCQFITNDRRLSKIPGVTTQTVRLKVAE